MYDLCRSWYVNRHRQEIIFFRFWHQRRMAAHWCCDKPWLTSTQPTGRPSGSWRLEREQDLQESWWDGLIKDEATDVGKRVCVCVGKETTAVRLVSITSSVSTAMFSNDGLSIVGLCILWAVRARKQVWLIETKLRSVFVVILFIYFLSYTTSGSQTWMP